MSSRDSYLRCAGCGTSLAPDAPLPFSCPNTSKADDVDHVLQVQLDLTDARLDDEDDRNPFIRFRHLLHSYRLARRSGLEDDDYQSLVRAIDASVAAVDGAGFAETPYGRSDDLGVSIKNETRIPGGTHKARHLMGIALHLEIIGKLGLVPGLSDRPLAIASCGNAAVAAAVLARAVGRRLQVFVPPWAATSVVDRLDALGAERVVCPRQPSDPPGDPCVFRYREAVANGALPFACQGSENALTIDGGQTLAWELALQHAASSRPPLDRLFVQVGGGALASSVIRGLRVAKELGVIPRVPRIHAVQPANAHPLRRAWQRTRARAQESSIAEAVEYAAHHRSEFMQPWPDEPKSIATGILDDETYDWVAVVEGLLESNGSVVLASEVALREARDLTAGATGTPASATGAAGYAGYLCLASEGAIDDQEEIAVLLTGAQR